MTDRQCDFAYFDAERDAMVVCNLPWDHAGDHILVSTPVRDPEGTEEPLPERRRVA